jgi:TIR domain
MTTNEVAPRLFVSYSHDSQSHKDWVLTLATRLVANGVDVILDQWDLNLGADLPRFMEKGLTESKLVLAVCSAQYVSKANAGKGGVGYEKMILTSQLMHDVTAERILPVIRNNNVVPLLPTFLGSRVYVDFRDDALYEVKVRGASS